jgi:hypothetical protein
MLLADDSNDSLPIATERQKKQPGWTAGLCFLSKP